MIARFKCGNEERGSKYWKEEKEIVFRLCNGARETLGHMLQEFKELKRENVNDQSDTKGRRTRSGVDAYGSGRKGEENKNKMKEEVKTKAQS